MAFVICGGATYAVNNSNATKGKDTCKNLNKFIYKHNNSIKKDHIRIYISFLSCSFRSCFS